MKDTKIIITTFMRENMQKAIFQIPNELRDVTYMFTREDRVDELRKYIPEDVRIVANPMDIDGIADIRQRCIENPAIGKGKVWFIDDLATFGWRDAELKQHNDLDSEKFLQCYEMLSGLLNTYMQVGFSPRGGNNRVSESHKEIGRAYTTYGLRTDWMDENDIRFDGMYRKDRNIKLYEDYWITLSMLTKGHKNTIIYDYYFNYNHNSSGGNSTFRNLELQKAAAEMLRSQFPHLVTIETKEGTWGKMGMENRKEVSIQWQKAFKSFTTATPLF